MNPPRPEEHLILLMKEHLQSQHADVVHRLNQLQQENHTEHMAMSTSIQQNQQEIVFAKRFVKWVSGTLVAMWGFFIWVWERI